MVNRMILNETSYFGQGAVENVATEILARGFKKAVVEYGLLPILLAIFSTCKFFWQFNSRYKGAFVVLVMFCISLYQRFDLNLITNTIVLYTAFELQQNRKKI